MTEASSHRTQHTPCTDNALRVCTTLKIHTRPEPLSPLSVYIFLRADKWYQWASVREDIMARDTRDRRLYNIVSTIYAYDSDATSAKVECNIIIFPMILPDR